MFGLESFEGFDIIFETHTEGCVHNIAAGLLIHDFQEHDYSPNTVLVSDKGEDLLQQSVNWCDKIAVNLWYVRLCSWQFKLL